MTIIVADDQISLAIGKKGQNVRLAAKLVKLKIDIQGQSGSVDPLSISNLLPTNQKRTSSINFLSEISTAKGLGEKITAILFEGNVVTANNVIEQGTKGLSSLPGIGPKKAKLILEFAEKIIENQSEDAISAKTADETQTAETSGEQEEEKEIPIDQLSEISPSVIESLLKSGFETLAELSVTRKEELVEIDGIDLETATIIIEQAKNQLANDE